MKLSRERAFWAQRIASVCNSAVGSLLGVLRGQSPDRYGSKAVSEVGKASRRVIRKYKAKRRVLT